MPSTRHPLLRPLWILALHVAVLVAGRLALLLLHRAEFAELSTAELLGAFARGLRFDLSIVAAVVGVPVLLLALPMRWAAARPWQWLWSRVALALLVASVAVVVGDHVVFGLFHRHLGVEVATVGGDVDMLAAVAVQEYPGAVVTFALATLAAVLVWRRLERWDGAERSGRARWGALALLPLLVLAVRGGVGGKPLGIVNAFDSGSLPGGYLALNGPFSLLHSLRRGHAGLALPMEYEPAVRVVRQEVLGARPAFSDPAEPDAARYPLARAVAAAAPPRPLRNVVVLLLESWTGRYVDALRAARDLPPLGATPHFDALAREGLLLTRFYAVGQNSMKGLTGVLTGLPVAPGLPHLGYGLEQCALSNLGTLARAQGYETHFLQASKRSSFRVDAIAAVSGFDAYLGMEDVVARLGCAPMADWGVWDEDLLTTLSALDRAAPRPFLGFAFTASTHRPFQVPPGYTPRLEGGDEERDYLRSLSYADECIGRYFDAARADGYFEDTVFVLVADHCARLEALAGPDPLPLFHVPCLILAPGLEPRVLDEVTSQADLLPTVFELAGWTGGYSGLGTSLVEPLPEHHGAMCLKGDLVLRVEREGWVLHDMERVLKTSAPAPGFDAEGVTRRLEATVSVLGELVRTNRIADAQAQAQ